MSRKSLYFYFGYSDVFDFTVDGYSFSSNGYSDVKFYFDTFNGWITFERISGGVYHYNMPAPPAYTITAELTYNQDGQSGSTGQITLMRTAGSSTDTYYFNNSSSNPTNKLYMPWNDGREVTFHIIIRVNNVKKSDTEFTTIAPINFVVTSISPSTLQTGKVHTVNIGASVPSNNRWVVTSPLKIYAYHNTSSSAEYNWYYVNAFINDGTTEVTSSSNGFSQFKFYWPYVSGRAKTDDSGKIETIYTLHTIDLWTLTSYGSTVAPTNSFSETYTYTFTWSYVNQTDNAAGPRFNSTPVTPTPTGLVEQYGKYIGGGITVLNYGWNASWRFGASFSSITYSLYNASDDSLINSWTYSTQVGFNLTLDNAVNDTSAYMTVTITMSNGALTTATYPTYQSYAYSNPEIISLNASRCNQDGTANDSGAYCKISYQFKVTSLDNQNSKEVTLTAPDGSHVYTNLDYNHGSAYQYISAADIEHSYQISLVVEDDFMSVSRSMNISTAGVIMDFLYDGKGIGLGKVAENSQMVEVNPQWTLKAQTIMIKGQDLETILTSLGYVFPT